LLYKKARAIPHADVNGIKIYYELHGKGETVAFLNGILANTSSWMNQLPLFSERFEVLLLDFRGQGKSEKPATKYTMEMHADDLKALLDSLKIEKLHVVGISLGAEVALIFALKYPDRVKSLVAACAVTHVNRTLKAMAERWLIAARLRSGKYLFQTVYPDIFSDEFIEKKWDFVNSTASLYDTSLDMDAFIELLKGFLELNITSQLSKIKKPTLIIAAEKDRVKHPKYSHIIHKNIPGSEFVIIKDSGHTLIWEKPEEFNTVALGFLEKHGVKREDTTP